MIPKKRAPDLTWGGYRFSEKIMLQQKPPKLHLRRAARYIGADRRHAMTELRLIVAGAGGRMGRTLVRAIADTPGMTLAGASEAAGSPLIGEDSGVLAGMPANRVPLVSEVKALAIGADGIIDFTVPAATVAFAALAADANIVHIIGTTGLSSDDETKIMAAARKTAIVKSGNMSLGVNLLAALARRVAKT